MSNILEIDILTMAAAAGHAACHRLAYVMGDGVELNCWINGGGQFGERDMERDVQTLAAYVCSRRDVHGEQLFLKARELGLHRFKDAPFDQIAPWMRTAYALFAASVDTTFHGLQQAQNEMRHEAERFRAAPVNDDVAGSPIPLDAEPVPTVESGDTPSTASVDVEVMDEHYAAIPAVPTSSPKKHKR